MTFSQSISNVFRNYVTFSGRASRSEFWYFVLFVWLVSFVLGAIAGVTNPRIFTEFTHVSDNMVISINNIVPAWYQTITSLFGLVIFLPMLAVSVRRLHDTGHGGGWILMNFVPLIGQIWYLILMILPSDDGDNRFGPKPC